MTNTTRPERQRCGIQQLSAGGGNIFHAGKPAAFPCPFSKRPVFQFFTFSIQAWIIEARLRGAGIRLEKSAGRRRIELPAQASIRLNFKPLKKAQNGYAENI